MIIIIIIINKRAPRVCLGRGASRSSLVSSGASSFPRTVASIASIAAIAIVANI